MSLASALARALEPELNATLDSRRRGQLPERVVIRLQTVEQTANERVVQFNRAFDKTRNRISAEMRLLQTRGMKKVEVVRRLRRMAEEFSQVGKRFSACSGNCTHCCHIPVGLYETEARVIGKAIGREPERAQHDPLLSERPYGYDRACPFLKEGRCSIYEHRPLACRLQLNLDVDDLLCELVPDASVPVPLANTSAFHVLYAAACQDDTLADIRDFFPAKTPPA